MKLKHQGKIASNRNRSVDTEDEKDKAFSMHAGAVSGQIGLEVSGKSPPWEGRPTCEQDLQRAGYKSRRRAPRNGKYGKEVQRD